MDFDFSCEGQDFFFSPPYPGTKQVSEFQSRGTLSLIFWLSLEFPKHGLPNWHSSHNCTSAQSFLGQPGLSTLSFQTQHKSILCFCSPPWEKLAGETGTCLATSVMPLNEASRLHPTLKWILTHNHLGIVNWSLPTFLAKTWVLGSRRNLQQKKINLEERTFELGEL